MVSSAAWYVAYGCDPVSKGDEIYVEVANGIGKTLASAADNGSLYRFQDLRDTFGVRTISVASYSHALVLPGDALGDGSFSIQ